MDNIKLITLKSEKTYMAEIVDDEKYRGAIVMKQPLQVVLVPPQRPGGEGSIAFIPFIEFSEEFKTGIPISPNDVLTVTTPVVQMINQYNQLFGSGIQIAQNITPIKR